MARPVRFNITPKERDNNGYIGLAEMPPGQTGGIFTTKLSEVVGLARKNSYGLYLLLPPAVVLNLSHYGFSL